MVLSFTGMLYHTTQLVVFFHCPFFLTQHNTPAVTTIPTHLYHFDIKLIMIHSYGHLNWIIDFFHSNASGVVDVKDTKRPTHLVIESGGGWIIMLDDLRLIPIMTTNVSTATTKYISKIVTIPLFYLLWLTLISLDSVSSKSCCFLSFLKVYTNLISLEVLTLLIQQFPWPSSALWSQLSPHCPCP